MTPPKDEGGVVPWLVPGTGTSCFGSTGQLAAWSVEQRVSSWGLKLS